MRKKALVIYYDGNDMLAKFLEEPEFGPNTMVSSKWGLSPDHQINAVVSCNIAESEIQALRGSNWSQVIDVYIDEMPVIIDGEENEL